MRMPNVQSTKSFWSEKSSSWFCCKLVWNEVVLLDCQLRWVVQRQVRCTCIHGKNGPGIFQPSGCHCLDGRHGGEGTRGYLTSFTPYLAKLKMRGKQTPPLFAPQYLCSPFFTNWGWMGVKGGFWWSFPSILLYNRFKQSESLSPCIPFLEIQREHSFPPILDFHLYLLWPWAHHWFSFLMWGPNIWPSYLLF